MEEELKSNISGFYKKNLSERQEFISKIAHLNESEIKILKNFGYFKSYKLNSYIENVIASFQLPMGIATNFKVNGKDYFIPMVTEEPSVIAAASNGARFARKYGGFISQPIKSIMIGQIQIINIKKNSFSIIKEYIYKNKQKLINLANEMDEKLVELGGGAKDLEIREIRTSRGEMIILHLLVDVLDAMGANAVNTMVESIAVKLTDEISVTANLKIISNLAINRIAKCTAIFDTELLGGPEIVDKILDAYAFAQEDPFRAATHNKGILNGITALALSTGNDTRAIEAGAHAYASFRLKKKTYTPLSHYYKDVSGKLVGTIALPLPMATFGGITNKHPMVKIAFKILNVKTAEELSQIAVAVGLAQNIAALRALVSEGIQHGHMKLHERKINQ